MFLLLVVLKLLSVCWWGFVAASFAEIVVSAVFVFVVVTAAAQDVAPAAVAGGDIVAADKSPVVGWILKALSVTDVFELQFGKG